MPICKQCNKIFSNFIVINGKKRNLHNRKYCLECSPFGLHNTRPIEKKFFQEDLECICEICGRKYIYSYDKNKKKAIKGHTKKHCNSCNVNRNKIKIKEKIVKYKGSRCVVCGYSKCPQVLNLHHLDPSKKNFQISGCHCYSWEKIHKELDKCILVCSNCHGEIHSGFIKLSEPEKYLGCICEVKDEKSKIKIINYCIDCNKEISRQAKRCLKCNSVKRYKTVRPSPEILQKDIKELGYCGTGRKYGVSDNAIRKW